MCPHVKRLTQVGVCLALFAGALFLRLQSLRGDVQADELSWVWRSIRFGAALVRGDWSGTVYTGHPGVTTMAIGALTVRLYTWLDATATRPAVDWLLRLAWLDPQNAEAFTYLGRFLTPERVVMAIITALGVVGVYLVGQRTLGRGAAWLGAAFIALDPFLSSLGGLMHVDGLLTVFTVLSVLSLLAGLAGRRLYAWSATSGALAGLAVLTKTPALLLGPVCGLTFLLGWWWGRQERKPVQFILAGALWLAAFAGVIALWPALWTSRARVWELVTGTAEHHLERQTQPTGRAFYLLVVGFRATPLVLTGVLLSGILGIIERKNLPTLWSRRAVFVLAIWAIAFLSLSTVWGTKYDRYAAPALAALALVAASGWWWLISRARRWRLLARQGVALAVIVGHGAAGLSVFPHLALYANPLLGGAPLAAQLGLHPISEPGLSMAAAYLNHLPNARALRVATPSPAKFAPLFQGQTVTLSTESLPAVDWAVIPTTGDQTCPMAGAWPLVETFEAGSKVSVLLCASPYLKLQMDYLIPRVQSDDVILLDADSPLAREWRGPARLVVVDDLLTPAGLAERLETITGARRVWYVSYAAASPITRAWVSAWLEARDPSMHVETLAAGIGVGQALPGQAQWNLPEPFRFEDKMTLWGVESWGTARFPLARFALRWQPQTSGDYNVELSLLDGDGHARAVATGQLVSRETWAVSTWQVGQIYESVFGVPLPAGLPPGDYQVKVGLIDATTQSRLGVWHANEFEGMTVRVGQVSVAPAEGMIYPNALDIQKNIDEEAGPLTLVALSFLPEGGLAGDPLTCSLYWRARQVTSQDYSVRWQLLDSSQRLVLEHRAALSPYPTSRWRAGELINSWYDIDLDPLLPTGVYTLQLDVLDGSGQPVWTKAMPMGAVAVEQPARSFDLPSDIQHPLNVQFGSSMLLRGYAVERVSGEALQVTLVWQARTRPEGNLVSFVHVLDAANNIIAQADRLLIESGQVTSGWASGQVAVDRYTLSVPAGNFVLGVGLYDADSGRRLSVTPGEGLNVVRDRLILSGP